MISTKIGVFMRIFAVLRNVPFPSPSHILPLR